MCGWKQHFSVNLEALSSAAFRVRENPEGPQNKLLDLQAASKITSLSASLFPWVTLHSLCWQNIKEGGEGEDGKGHIHLSIFDSEFIFLSLWATAFMKGIWVKLNIYLSTGSLSIYRAWDVLPSNVQSFTKSISLYHVYQCKNTPVFSSVSLQWLVRFIQSNFLDYSVKRNTKILTLFC